MASIVKRGKSYRVQISLYEHGEHKRITKTFTTKKEAKLWGLEMELAKGKGQDLANRTTSFADFFENWIYLVKQSDVKETTFQNYERTLGVIKSLFQDIQLKDLNDIVVQKKIDEYAKTHARKTTHEVLLKIKTALRDAYARGYISNDFAGLVKTRGIEAPKRNKALSITNLKKLRNHVLQYPDDEFNLLVLLALETGARRSELLALRPKSFYKYGIRIEHSISPTSISTSLKTENAKRNISINKEVYNLIKNVTVKENGYIFDFDGFQQYSRICTLIV